MCRKEKILTLVSILILILTAIFVVARCCRKDEVAVQQTGNVDITDGPVVYSDTGAIEVIIDNSDFTIVSTTAFGGVFRIVDDDAGVVCWIYLGGDPGGISCLPIEQTRLDR